MIDANRQSISASKVMEVADIRLFKGVYRLSDKMNLEEVLAGGPAMPFSSGLFESIQLQKVQFPLVAIQNVAQQLREWKGALERRVPSGISGDSLSFAINVVNRGIQALESGPRLDWEQVRTVMAQSAAETNIQNNLNRGLNRNDVVGMQVPIGETGWEGFFVALKAQVVQMEKKENNSNLLLIVPPEETLQGMIANARKNGLSEDFCQRLEVLRQRVRVVHPHMEHGRFLVDESITNMLDATFSKITRIYGNTDEMDMNGFPRSIFVDYSVLETLLREINAIMAAEENA